jgi:outer membrane protein assembly factor BamB
MASNVMMTVWNQRVRVSSAKAGTVGWESKSILASCSAVVVKGVQPADAHLYVGTLQGDIHKLSFATGAEQAQLSGAGGYVWGLAHDKGVVYAHGGNSLTAHKVGLGLLWKYNMDDLAWGTPAVADGMVYSGSWDGRLHAVRLDGTPAWISSEFYFFAAEPVVADGVVYAVAGEKLVALDAATGTVLWTTTAGNGANLVSPVSVEDGRIYAGTAWGAMVCAFDVSQGTELWSTPFGGHPTPPTTLGGRVYAATEHGAGDGYLRALDAKDGTLLWTSAVPVGRGGDAVSRAAFDMGGFIYGAGKPVSDNVFVTSQNGNGYAFSRATGQLAWHAPVGNGWPIDPIWTDAGTVLGLERHFPEAATIDPMALVLRGDIYIKLHLPYPQPMALVMAKVRRMAGGMNAEETCQALGQLQTMESAARNLTRAVVTGGRDVERADGAPAEQDPLQSASDAHA